MTAKKQSHPPESQHSTIQLIDADDPAILLEQCQASLRGYLISLTANMQDVDDLLQETNHYLVEHLDQFEQGSHFKAWAFSVARYCILAQQRDRSRSRISYMEDATIELLANSAIDRLPGEDERIHTLRHCIQKLAPGERSLVRQVYIDKKSLTHIAENLGRSANALHKTISRIRQALRVCIEQHITRH
ncbi:sigma-70 family RNA polymerase sigma factor [Verrucomicrobiaceae bacterium N1E253]|uniref:Sigma-70 family RNA polymerase sigma factor n=1 Tax=Oceaniferula marina TaxID=2748318 RepID=A0A851GGS1_9BACT|nr:sigma-70 family RNA polymerase sigma factor [Oceaniferula marina]NWK54445.1 sigma-70 family RNA polymerase sigma factor [Oceaniferula marina]